MADGASLESSSAAEVALRDGWVEPAVAGEFAGLGLRYGTVVARPRRSPPDVKQRLRHLSDRLHGQWALNLRREPIASAYRVFFRQIGLDPDEFRTPVEAAMVERMRAGRLASQGLVDDALTIATVETGVAVRAFDADRTSGRLGVRIAQPGERLGGDRDGPELPEDTLVVADERSAVSLIFGETAPGRGVQRRTGRIVVCAIKVAGVPGISIEEAIWTCAGVLQTGGRR